MENGIDTIKFFAQNLHHGLVEILASSSKGGKGGKMMITGSRIPILSLLDIVRTLVRTLEFLADQEDDIIRF